LQIIFDGNLLKENLYIIKIDEQWDTIMKVVTSFWRKCCGFEGELFGCKEEA